MGETTRIDGTDGAGLSELGPVKRVVLKLSGESLAGDSGYGIDPASLDWTASSIAEAVRAGAEMAVVVGGGNIFRGSHVAAELGIEGATADYMSMLGTVINAMALQAALEGQGGAVPAVDVHLIAPQAGDDQPLAVAGGHVGTAGDDDIVNVAFADSGAGDAAEARLGLQFRDRRAAGVAHAGAQAADELVHERR